MTYVAGQRVYVNVSGLVVGGSSGQVSFGGQTQALGFVLGRNLDGTYRVRLAMSIMGATDFNVGEGRMRLA